jgi:RNA polymerase-interacting CarD/CdnL/TRCF family regulator
MDEFSETKLEIPVPHDREINDADVRKALDDEFVTKLTNALKTAGQVNIVTSKKNGPPFLDS